MRLNFNTCTFNTSVPSFSNVPAFGAYKTVNNLNVAQDVFRDLEFISHDVDINDKDDLDAAARTLYAVISETCHSMGSSSLNVPTDSHLAVLNLFDLMYIKYNSGKISDSSYNKMRALLRETSVLANKIQKESMSKK